MSAIAPAIAPAIAYVNGAFVPLQDARVSVLDRGFLFADGVYEVTTVLDGGLIDNDNHMARLKRSLAEIAMAMPVSEARLTELQFELARRNGLREGLIYMQVTRGAGTGRDFRFPEAGTEPGLVMFVQHKPVIDVAEAQAGVGVITVPDLRWQRRDIKSTALLAQVLAKQQAAEAGAFEAWMVEDGLVTEGGSSSAFIITRERAIVARPLDHSILPGVTRISVLDLASQEGLRIEARAFSLEEAHEAAEAFLTSASAFVMPVVRIDGRPVGDGRPGPLSRRLRALYIETARRNLLTA